MAAGPERGGEGHRGVPGAGSGVASRVAAERERRVVGPGEVHGRHLGVLQGAVAQGPQLRPRQDRDAERRPGRDRRPRAVDRGRRVAGLVGHHGHLRVELRGGRGGGVQLEEVGVRVDREAVLGGDPRDEERADRSVRRVERREGHREPAGTDAAHQEPVGPRGVGREHPRRRPADLRAELQPGAQGGGVEPVGELQHDGAAPGHRDRSGVLGRVSRGAEVLDGLEDDRDVRRIQRDGRGLLRTSRPGAEGGRGQHGQAEDAGARREPTAPRTAGGDERGHRGASPVRRRAGRAVREGNLG